MKLELWLIDRENPIKKQMFEVDLPVVPRRGEVLLIGETANYEVTDVVYRFDDEGRFTSRISVDAWSLWNHPGKE